MIETLPAWLTAEQARLLTRAAEILEAEHHVCEAQVVRMVAYAQPAPLAREHVEALRQLARDCDEAAPLWAEGKASQAAEVAAIAAAGEEHMRRSAATIRAALRALGVE